MRKIAHVKHWELHTSSLEEYTAYWSTLSIGMWTTDRQDERSDMCVKAGLNDSTQWCYQMNCIVFVLCTVEISIQSADRQGYHSC